jgi:hypoxanthine phosphoribosyltransferase
MTQIHPRDSQRPEFEANSTDQMVSQREIESSSSNMLLHKRILVVDDNSDIGLTLRIGLEESDPTMQVHTFDNPLTA